MLHTVGATAGRAAAVVPVTLLMLFIGLLWLLGLACGQDRRDYVEKISGQAMLAVSAIWQGTASTELTAPGSSRQP